MDLLDHAELRIGTVRLDIFSIAEGIESRVQRVCEVLLGQGIVTVPIPT